MENKVLYRHMKWMAKKTFHRKFLFTCDEILINVHLFFLCSLLMDRRQSGCRIEGKIYMIKQRLINLRGANEERKKFFFSIRVLYAEDQSGKVRKRHGAGIKAGLYVYFVPLNLQNRKATTTLAPIPFFFVFSSLPTASRNMMSSHD